MTWIARYPLEANWKQTPDSHRVRRGLQTRGSTTLPCLPEKSEIRSTKQIQNSNLGNSKTGCLRSFEFRISCFGFPPKVVRCVGSAPTPPGSRPGMHLLHQHLGRWGLRSDSHRRSRHYECRAWIVSATEAKWRSREDSHLEPPPSQGGMQISYTSRAEMVGSPAQPLDPRDSLCSQSFGSDEERMAPHRTPVGGIFIHGSPFVAGCLHARLVARDGVAPSPPVLQTGALLTRAFEPGLVLPHGNAPWSVGYRAPE